MSISIEQLRYISLGTRDLPAAIAFAEQQLGLQATPAAKDEARFRSDERQYTLHYDAGATGAQAIGVELRDLMSLQNAASALKERGVTATRDDALAVKRNAKALLWFVTPGGLRVELLIRPQNQGQRFFPSRASGVTGLAALAVRCTDIAADEALWTQVFGARVGDWVQDAVYLGFDDAHHRLALYPARRNGVLAVEFSVESTDAVMQQFYRLRQSAGAVVHGPGRRPTSEQSFITFRGPDEVFYSFVAEGRRIDAAIHRPRQFAREPASYCCWGSDCHIPELLQREVGLPRPGLRGVPAS